MTGSRKLLAFGEVMLRLSPPRGELLLQSPRFDVWVAGAEANVATQLARLGHEVAFATRLPDNDLGRAARGTLRGHGVDVERIVFGGHRMGLYFVTPGASVRAPEVFYDREGSAFAGAPVESWDWDVLLRDVDRLHLSGITPALGMGPAESAIAAAEAAAARGIPVSFDGNWRGKLWARWGGDARAILTRIVEHADILFGDHRDIALLLGQAAGEGETDGAFPTAAAAAFGAFPRLRIIAATSRRAIQASRHYLRGWIATPEECFQTAEAELSDIVDRVGSGDAFVSGVLHALRSGGDVEAAMENGLALAALKHSLVGDAAIFTLEQVDAWRLGHRDVRR